jgi:hypothetical protein
MSKWWYLDLAADFPELEIYHGGWKAEQETGLLELGDRVMTEQAMWLPTWFYSQERDRIQAAVGYMFRVVLQFLRDHRQEDLQPGDQWYPDTGRYS